MEDNRLFEEDLTTENAPLFLVMDVTKRTMKMVYVDTPEFAADDIFQEMALNVKRLNTMPSDDERYIFVGCRINRRDSEIFKEAIQRLEEKMVCNGYDNYRAWTLAALIELIEGSINASFEEEQAESEYPKNVLIPFIPSDSLEDSLRALYALLKIDGINPEIGVMNSNPPSRPDGYILPEDVFVLVLRPETPIEYKTFRRVYEKHRSGANAIISLGDNDDQRVSIMLLPEYAYKDSGIPLSPVVTFYDRETEAKLSDFFQKWDMEYQKLP